jgi:hypothetical protein
MKRYTVRKFDGDDMYSWAIFRKGSLPKGHRGVVFSGEARPILCGLGREDAIYRAKALDKSDPEEPKKDKEDEHIRMFWIR